MSIFVSHPGLQHSHQLAWALHDRGLLQNFWSGVPVLDEAESPPAWMPTRYARKLKITGIPVSLRRHPVIFPALVRGTRFLPSSFPASDSQHRIFHLFDRWVAGHIKNLRPRVVIAYENSAYHTFQAAKQIGARCILDAASFHHTTVQRLMRVKETPYLAEINRRKDAEIDAAELILTCSPLAAQSYLDAGVPNHRIHTSLLGAELPSVVARSGIKLATKPLHFVFAGGLRYLKGIDFILSAFQKLHAEAHPYTLTFIGGEGEAGWIRKIQKTPGASYCSNLPQKALFQKLAQADCLLLPSRFDSFGMVVAEAMACGTPAIVSTQVGSKAIIEQFPDSGWIISPDANALYECVKSLIQRPEQLTKARAVAFDAAQQFTWQAYRQRVGLFIEQWMQEHT